MKKYHTYSLQWLLNRVEQKEKMNYFFFWGHAPSKDGSVTKSCFSQWWESAFEVDGIRYATAEHWMMAKKAVLFDDKEMLERILVAKSSAEAKKDGKKGS